MKLQREAVGPGVIRKFEKTAAACRPGIVDQHVAALEAFADLLEHLFAGFQRSQVAGNRQRLEASGGNGFGAFGKRRWIGRREHRLRTLTRETGGDRPPDAAAAAGDHHDFSLKFSSHRTLPAKSEWRLYAAPPDPARGLPH